MFIMILGLIFNIFNRFIYILGFLLFFMFIELRNLLDNFYCIYTYFPTYKNI